MNPIRKQFDSNSAFPFSFVYRGTKSTQTELPDHIHDWYELVYVYRGTGTLFIDQTIYDMRQGDLFAIPGNTIHRALPDKDDPVTSTAIFFSPMLVQHASFGDSFSYLHCFEQQKKLKNYKFELLPQQQHDLELSMEHIHNEIQALNLGYRQAIVLQLQTILLLLNRQTGPNGGQGAIDSSSGPNWMREILLYIDDHLFKDIGLSTVSRKASVTSAHFSRVFKQTIGMNLTEYIMTKRIIRAKELLNITDHNISLIAEMCGFETLPHFHRMFKKVLGITPAAYRKSAKGILEKN
ncbi:helix-turn-helix domain-containing protein [Paenibacillus sp. LMG 31456]|uniref:Helix-turn-helix domain-containing protein n=1 Tax=Paenibacillus foliorum TaxID=2654974 RepID=A0A972K178_9BACL|nr:AraC family transcriptional regulator [Paenibacillus foliorum]NOU96414.1 helix-turn-helix domain-containing protein [Paenibacillus foliorum]